MRIFALTAMAVLAAGVGFSEVKSSGKLAYTQVKNFRAPAVVARECVPGFIWLEAESFADYGGWKFDTQFTHKMGSAYLLAAGVLKPLDAARTKLNIPRSGTWRVWARTKDWLPEFSPGTFAVKVGGRRGAVLGASRKEGWGWETAGEFALPAGEVEVALEDLSGAFARCDALLFTTDLEFRPPEEAEALLAARRKFTGENDAIEDGGEYDLVVVGAGSGGLGVALAAARHGARVALVHDRPVLGGNASSELGVSLDGAAVISGDNRRETGMAEEAFARRAATSDPSFSTAFAQMAAELGDRLSVFDNLRVLSAEKHGDIITSVLARHTATGKRTRFRARLFADGTGDGWLGRFAGADSMYGREAKAEYCEWPAPEKGDELTMSGCLMSGNSSQHRIGYDFRHTGHPVAFTTPEWARVLPKGFARRVRGLSPEWWVEHGGRFDDVADPERARDELVRINFAYWGWIKNESPLKPKAADVELVSMPHMNARREGYRLAGDYVLAADDALSARMFPDRISYGGWPLDTHDPLGIDNPHGNGYWKHHPSVPIYSIPYRCVYSRNVPNLLLSGRCVSVTHIALGSVRVQATLFALGQATGTAAAMMLRRGLLPREFGAHVGELQQQLLKDDLYIPNLRNEDPADLARKARVSATSGGKTTVFDCRHPDNRRHDRMAHSLDAHARSTCFARGKLNHLDAFQLLLVSSGANPIKVVAKVMEAPSATVPSAAKVLAEVEAEVPARHDGFVRFQPKQPILLSDKFVWVVIQKTKGLSWALRERPMNTADRRAYSAGGGVWTPMAHEQYAIVTEPALKVANGDPRCVIDGVARPVGDEYHGWISEPAQPLPQSIQLDFPQPVKTSEVRIAFDTDLSPWRYRPRACQLVRDYTVEVSVGGKWKQVAEVKDNNFRHRVHAVREDSVEAVRVNVLSTWGDPSARIFEIRVY